jgi:sugar/nucleoside kinase (ribokinase family)
MNQAHTVKTRLNVFKSFSPVIPETYREAPHVLLGNIHPSLQLDVLEQIHEPRLVLCDTMNYWIESEPALLKQVFRKVDVICVNDGEARQFCRTSSLPQAAKQLLKLGPRWVIVKMGTAGCLLFGKDTFFSLPALPLLTVKDPTGAGDSFAGGLMGCLARSRTINDTGIRRSLVAGTVLASICVEGFGPSQTRNIRPGEIRRRASMLRKATRVPSFTCA